MISEFELNKLRELRIDLLHVWKKLDSFEFDKSRFNDYQNILDTIISRESRIIENRKELLK